jgi:hypothetical protein
MVLLLYIFLTVMSVILSYRFTGMNAFNKFVNGIDYESNEYISKNVLEIRTAFVAIELVKSLLILTLCYIINEFGVPGMFLAFSIYTYSTITQFFILKDGLSKIKSVVDKLKND